jgi:hypothetical protein
MCDAGYAGARAGHWRLPPIAGGSKRSFPRIPHPEYRCHGPSRARLERALAFVAGGHTAGEAMLVRRLADADPPALAAGLARIPATSACWDAIDVRLTGLVIFED